ncbi:unnamed protein product, partial [Clonostachys rosea]
DSFYKPLSPRGQQLAFENKYDFDCPDAFDFDLLVQVLQKSKDGFDSRSRPPNWSPIGLPNTDERGNQKAEIPVYSFEKHQRLDETNVMDPPQVLVLEGLSILYEPRVLALLNLKVGENTLHFLFILSLRSRVLTGGGGKIFADADAEVYLARRIRRDVIHRGRDVEGILAQWLRFVKPNYGLFVQNQRVRAGQFQLAEGSTYESTDLKRYNYTLG